MTETGISNLLTNAWGLTFVIAFFCGAIFFHELGHFLAAKWRGLKIERFSIGFGPRLFGWTGKDGVDYRISLLPFGGYVALPQLADMRAVEGESSVPTDSLPPLTYTDKMLVTAAGPLFNVILAFFLACLVWVFGYPTSTANLSTTVGYVAPTMALDRQTTVPSPALEAGLQPGDQILAVDGHRVENWANIATRIATGDGRDDLGNPKTVLTLQREGEVFDLPVYPRLQVINARSGKDLRMIGIMPAYLLRIASVSPGSPAERAGVQIGDRVVAVEGQTVYSIPEINQITESRTGQTVQLSIEREGQPMTLTVTPAVVPVTKSLLEITSAEAGATWQLLPEAAGETVPGAPAGLSVFTAPEERPWSRLLPGRMLITGANGQSATTPEAMAEVLAATAGEGVILEGLLRGQPHQVSLPGDLDVQVIPPRTRTLLGFTMTPDTVITHPGPIKQIRDQTELIFTFLGSLLSPKSDVGVGHLSGPVGIGRVIHTFSLEDLRLALWFAVLLNINLAILNLLPIPVLDGGHMAFATLAKITGRRLSPSLIATTQGAFMLMLFGLMFYLVFNDSLDWIGDREVEHDMQQQDRYYIDPAFPPPQP